jgi:hypothetical protein
MPILFSKKGTRAFTFCFHVKRRRRGTDGNTAALPERGLYCTAAVLLPFVALPLHC